MRWKYINEITIEDWLRVDMKSIKGASNVWKYLVKALLLVGKWIAWEIGSGIKVRVGKDP